MPTSFLREEHADTLQNSFAGALPPKSSARVWFSQASDVAELMSGGNPKMVAAFTLFALAVWTRGEDGSASAASPSPKASGDWTALALVCLMFAVDADSGVDAVAGDQATLGWALVAVPGLVRAQLGSSLGGWMALSLRTVTAAECDEMAPTAVDGALISGRVLSPTVEVLDALLDFNILCRPDTHAL